MKLFHQQSKYENAAYAVLWGVLFAAPLLSVYLRTISNAYAEFPWREVLMVWQHFAIYLLLFLIHNYLLAPLLIYRHRNVMYFSLAICLVAVFGVYECTDTPDHVRHDGNRHGWLEERMPEGMQRGGHAPGDRMHGGMHDAPFAAGEMPPMDEPDMMADGGRAGKKPNHVPPPFIGEHDIVAILVLILLFGANLGVKGYVKSYDDRRKLAAMERKSLEQQLEYLKYQINPHFFMNTLNNIHALIDIDPAKAQETVLDLSKMMRFILYEGDKNGVPLTREMEFIGNYIKLMRLRYTDKVNISVDLPTELPNRQLPPLLLITFIENAFKHGISYQHDSFIDIKVGIAGDRLDFRCRNSKADQLPGGTQRQPGGVGLSNVKQRLRLIYGDDFNLHIDDHSDVYEVALDIPLSRESAAG